MDYLLRFPGLADFGVSADGLQITCVPTPEVGNETLRHLYLNQVLPLALSKQGKLIFHASAVEIGGLAIAFAGQSGRGKSTLATSFATNGYRFLTDDGLRVEANGSDYRVLPSHPSIRLWQDSRSALIKPDAKTAPTLKFTSKSCFLAGKSIPFCDSPRPLRKFYFLDDGGVPGITFRRMKPAEALIELVKHSFLLDIEEQDLLAAHFDELSEMVSQRIYYHLDYPRRYEDLPDIRRQIIMHATENDKAA